MKNGFIHILLKLLPFWLFIVLFKVAAGLHFSILPVLGEQVLPIWIVGLIIGGASLLQVIFDVPTGFILDRFGYVRVMLITTGLFLLGGVVWLFDFSPWTYVISVVFGFFGWVAFGPGINAYVLGKARSDEGGRYMGMLHTMTSLGVVGAMVLLIFLVHTTPQVIALILIGVFALAILTLSVVKRDRVSLHAIQQKHRHHAYYIHRRVLKDTLKVMKELSPAAQILAFQNFAAALFYGVIWFVVPLVIASQENSSVLGLGMATFDLAVVILGALLGKWADRYKKKRLILLGLLIFSIAAFLVSFNLNVLFLLFGFLATAGDEMSSSSLWSWIESLDDDHRHDGLMNGVIVFFEDVGWMVGPAMAGILFELLGASWTIACAAIPISAVWAFSLFYFRHTPDPVLVETGEYHRKPTRRRHK